MIATATDTVVENVARFFPCAVQRAALSHLLGFGAEEQRIPNEARFFRWDQGS